MNKKLPENLCPGLKRAINIAGGRRIDLARKTGFTHQAVSRWITQGRISDKSLRKVAAALGVSPLVIGDFEESKQ